MSNVDLVFNQQYEAITGGPVRLVVPQMFAYKAVKWLVGMELVAAPHKGYWEERGYPVDAWIKPQQNKGGS